MIEDEEDRSWIGEMRRDEESREYVGFVIPVILGIAAWVAVYLLVFFIWYFF